MSIRVGTSGGWRVLGLESTLPTFQVLQVSSLVEAATVERQAIELYGVAT
jgi:hypothetical protein